MNTLWRPRFVYGTTGSTTDWTPELPQRPWGLRSPTVGGSKTAASGVPAAYVVRRDHLLDVTLRLLETEWADLVALVSWANEGAESFTFYPDTDETASYTVYLESPLAGAELAPVRDPEYPKMFEVPLVLRTTNAGAFTLEYFADA